MWPTFRPTLKSAKLSGAIRTYEQWIPSPPYFSC